MAEPTDDLELLRPGDDRFVVDVDGFEGPLDLLLELARRQKVDLVRISVLALAEQYLAFVEAARHRRLELAADYLVMAAWLAYLKSRLLLPAPPSDEEEPPAAVLAAALAFRLRRLEAMRAAAAQLMSRNLLGRDVFARGEPERLAAVPKPAYEATLYDLLSAYAAERARRTVARVQVRQRVVWSLAEARSALERLLGTTLDWAPLDSYLLAYVVGPRAAATVLASGLGASLELVREGRLELRQHAAFGRLYARARPVRAKENDLG